MLAFHKHGLCQLLSACAHSPVYRILSWLRDCRDKSIPIGGCPDCEGRPLWPSHLPPLPAVFRAGVARSRAQKRVQHIHMTAWRFTEIQVALFNYWYSFGPKTPAKYERRLGPYGISKSQQSMIQRMYDECLRFCRLKPVLAKGPA